MFNDLSSPKTYLASRRSAKARELSGPRPDADALRAMAEIALRSPDHGKLAPWRFTIVPDARRAAFRELLETAFRAANTDPRDSQVAAACQMADYDAALVVASYAPRPSAKIPEWEQQLSCGAAVMNLVHAIHAHDWVASWITGWAATDPTVTQSFCPDGGRIAGFVFAGTPGHPLEERERPDTAEIVSDWQG